MSLITLIGIEQLLDAQIDTIYHEQDSGMSCGGNGWDPNWANPSGLTGDWTPEVTNEVQVQLTHGLEEIAGSAEDFLQGIADIYTNAGKFFSTAPGGFFDSGVDPQTGLRTDGMPIGYGCGTAKTDGIVPDNFGRASLIESCARHDLRMETLGYSKALADQQLGQEVTNAIISAGYNSAIAQAVGKLYEIGVNLFGTEAYLAAQKKAAEGPGK